MMRGRIDVPVKVDSVDRARLEKALADELRNGMTVDEWLEAGFRCGFCQQERAGRDLLLMTTDDKNAELIVCPCGAMPPNFFRLPPTLGSL